MTYHVYTAVLPICIACSYCVYTVVRTYVYVCFVDADVWMHVQCIFVSVVEVCVSTLTYL